MYFQVFDERERMLTTTKNSIHSDGYGMKILVVDDLNPMRKMVKHLLLQLSPLMVEEAESGQMALQMIQTTLQHWLRPV